MSTEKATKTITYAPATKTIIKEIQLEEDFGFQVVKFDNDLYGVNYINPQKSINETVMIAVDKGEPLAPLTFLKYAELAYHKKPNLNLNEADKVELCVLVDPENKEIYRETINGYEAKTLIEKMSIAQEIVELQQKDNFWLNHGTSVILICFLINLALVLVNLFRLL